MNRVVDGRGRPLDLRLHFEQWQLRAVAIEGGLSACQVGMSWAEGRDIRPSHLDYELSTVAFPGWEPGNHHSHAMP